MKGEVGREPSKGSFHGLIKSFGRHTVNPRQIGIQNDALAANGPNEVFDG